MGILVENATDPLMDLRRRGRKEETGRDEWGGGEGRRIQERSRGEGQVVIYWNVEVGAVEA